MAPHAGNLQRVLGTPGEVAPEAREAALLLRVVRHAASSFACVARAVPGRAASHCCGEKDRIGTVDASARAAGSPALALRWVVCSGSCGQRLEWYPAPRALPACLRGHCTRASTRGQRVS